MFLRDTAQGVSDDNTRIRKKTTALALRLDTPSGAPATHRRPPVTSRLPGRPLHVLGQPLSLAVYELSRIQAVLVRVLDDRPCRGQANHGIADGD